MDTSCTFRNWLTAIIYNLCLLSGVICRGQQPADMHSLPKFLPTNENFTYRVGQVAILECSIENLYDKKVIWRLASKPAPLTVGYMSFSEDPRYAVEHDRGGTHWNLVIRDVQLSDAGVYECQVSSQMRHLRRHVTLMVTKSPTPLITTTHKPNIQISGSNYVDEGDRIHLVCNATVAEYPVEDIDWFRAGNTLVTDESRGLYIRKQVTLKTGTIFSTLEIKHAKLSDQGAYTCRTSTRDVTSTHVHVLNGDTSNVKRDSANKNSKAGTQGAITDPNTGASLHYQARPFTMLTLTALLSSHYLCKLGLT